MAFENPREAIEAWNRRCVGNRCVPPRKPWWKRLWERLFGG
jgi:hypothetical protein